MLESLREFGEHLTSPGVFHGFCLWVFIFGALIGSFLNVCIYRLPLGMSVNRPRRSFCFRCGTPIRWYDNIPVVSYLLLRGRDRACGAKFSPRYALVELFTGILFVWVFLAFNHVGAGRISIMSFWYMAFAAMLLVGVFTDFDHWIIPVAIPRWGTAAAIVAALLAGFFDRGSLIAIAGPFPAVRLARHDWIEMTLALLAGPGSSLASAGNVLWWEPAANAAIGAAFGYGFLVAVGIGGKLLFRKEAMGLGDADVFMLIGATMGAVNCFVILFGASVVGVALWLAAQMVGRMRAPAVPARPALQDGEWNEESLLAERRAEALRRFEEAVRSLGDPSVATEEEVQRARAFGQELGMDFIDLPGQQIDAATAASIAPDLAIRVKAVPLKVTAKSAHFAVANPLDSRLVAELRQALGANLRFSIATEDAVVAWLRANCLPAIERGVHADEGDRPLWRRYAQATALMPPAGRLHHLPFIPAIAIAAFAALVGHEFVKKTLVYILVP